MNNLFRHKGYLGLTILMCLNIPADTSRRSPKKAKPSHLRIVTQTPLSPKSKQSPKPLRSTPSTRSPKRFTPTRSPQKTKSPKNTRSSKNAEWHEHLIKFDKNFSDRFSPNKSTTITAPKSRPDSARRKKPSQVKDYRKSVEKKADAFYRGIRASFDGSMPGGEHRVEQDFRTSIQRKIPAELLDETVHEYMTKFKVTSARCVAAIENLEMSAAAIMTHKDFEVFYAEKKAQLLAEFGLDAHTAINRLSMKRKVFRSARPTSPSTPRPTP